MRLSTGSGHTGATGEADEILAEDRRRGGGDDWLSPEQLWEREHRETISDDNSIHPMQHPYMDQTMSMIDTPASGMPHQFWEHMATAFMKST